MRSGGAALAFFGAAAALIIAGVYFDEPILFVASVVALVTALILDGNPR